MKKKNRLVVLGGVGGMNCYLNVPLEEALARYGKGLFESKHDKDLIDKSLAEVRKDARIFEFDDEFGAYDVWPNVDHQGSYVKIDRQSGAKIGEENS